MKRHTAQEAVNKAIDYIMYYHSEGVDLDVLADARLYWQQMGARSVESAAYARGIEEEANNCDQHCREAHEQGKRAATKEAEV